MSELREAVLVAQDLFRKLGAGALEVVRFRIDVMREAGDELAARFWGRVARALRFMLASKDAAGENLATSIGERALPVLDQHYRTVFDALPHAYLLLDPNLAVVAANRKFLAAAASSRAELIGRGLFEVFPRDPEDRARDIMGSWRASLIDVLDTGRHVGCRARYALRGSDGVVRTEAWQAMTAPVFDERGRLQFVLQHISPAEADREDEELVAAE